MTNSSIKENSEKLLKKLAFLDEEELSELILYHNDRYFLLNDPEISDEAFDKLVETLRFINPLSKALEEIESKKAQVREKVVHKSPMLSLEKCYDDESLRQWAKKIKGGFMAMPKIDGVACSLFYDSDGKMSLAKTRGDGFVGENITNNAKFISFLPLQISEQNVEIRGEVYLPLSRFKKDYAKEFSSPRNLAAGALKLKESKKTKNFGLRFFPYDIRGLDLPSEKEKFFTLKTLGFEMMIFKSIDNMEEAKAFYIDLEKQRNSLDYEIDGVVFRANLLSEQARLGETAHHPRYAMAYKFHGESAQTKLVKVEWSVARTGVITPVAIVNPIFVSGANVTRASLHNLSIFKRLNLHEESLVEINRRGGVIPHLERVLSTKGKLLSPPTHCPSCRGEVIVSGEFLYCKNPLDCEEVVVEKLFHFCHTLQIEGLGEKILRKLFKEGLVRNYADIFRLDYNDFLKLERMGDVLAHKLLKEIENKKIISLPLFLASLGIHEVGFNVSELIANNFPDIEEILKLTKEDLLSIHGIGESIANSFINGLRDLKKEIIDLLSIMTIKDKEEVEVKDKSHPLFDKSVVFTGKMAHLERKRAQKMVQEVGGKAPESLNSKVDYLVIGDEGSHLLGQGQKSTKQKLAEKIIEEGHGLSIITETEFLKFFKEF